VVERNFAETEFSVRMKNKNVEDFYPLSPMQQGMLFHTLLAPDSGVYFEEFNCVLSGEPDVSAFERAWQFIVQRHSILRTGFLSEGLKEPVQVVHRAVSLPLEQMDWRNLSAGEQSQRLQEFRIRQRQAGFNITAPPLMRLMLIQLSESEYQFIWSYHHMLMDGWSVPQLLEEVFTCYEMFHRGLTPQLETVRPYRDYIVWLRKQNLAQAESYWRRTLSGFTAPVLIPVAGKKTESENERVACKLAETQLSAESTTALQNAARRNQVTLNTLVQGAWALLLSRYSGEEDIVFGATVSGRPPDLAGAENMTGLFINTLPVRVQVNENRIVSEWLRAVHTQQAEMRQYEYSPLVQVQSWSDVPRGTSLFESILVFENYPVQASAIAREESTLRVLEFESAEQTNYPLTVVALPGEQLTLEISYDAALFDEATVQRMLAHWRTLLENLAIQPQARLADLSMLTAAEWQQILVDWNQTQTEFPDNALVHRLFEKQAQQNPQSIALTFQQQQMTYQQLNEQSSKLAHYLIKQGVKPEVLVAICMERSIEMIVAVFGVLKAGGAYVPVDPSYPAERVQFMLRDCAAQIVLTNLTENSPRKSTELFANVSQIIHLNENADLIEQESATSPQVEMNADNLAYVIYTSGSTGKPKGTLLHHRGLCNFATAMIRDFKTSTGANWLQFATLSFDASIAEIFTALSGGATLHLITREISQSVPDLVDVMKRQRITHTILPPSLLKMLPAEELTDIRMIISGGEACTPEIVSRWNKGRQVINAYGPTECTVGPMLYKVPADAGELKSVPIGRPIANTQIYLLDQRQRPVPVGVPGEIYIGGVGVGRGYLHREALTAEKFIRVGSRESHQPSAVSRQAEKKTEGKNRSAEPEEHAQCSMFKAQFTPDGQLSTLPALPTTDHRPPATDYRLYRTGDLGRWLPDGHLEFLGRVDHQVKLRGFRIETGEIETILEQHPDVRESVVILREDIPGDQRLVAYVVPQNADDDPSLVPASVPSVADLRVHLMRLLPEFMIPSAFVMMDALPLTPNAKVDRKALPAPDGSSFGAERRVIAPRDTLEMQLVQLWEEILNVRPIGITDSFFELGGHSLLAVRVASTIEQRLKVVLPLVTMFQNPTIQQIAQMIRQQGSENSFARLVDLQAARKDSSQPPLFFVHPSGGSVHWYADLARHLGAQQPFIGIQARGLKPGESLHDSIEEMAADYADAICERQPQGPYLVGSWSLGVIIAFATAQELIRRGRDVALLALLDQGPFVPGTPPADHAEYLMQLFGRYIPLEMGVLRTLDEPAQIEETLRIAKSVNWVFPDLSREHFGHFVHILKTHTEAWRRYTPQKYPGQITLFRASQQPAESSDAPDLGWGEFAAEGVEVIHIEGDHLSLITEPLVSIVAEKLKDRLVKVAAGAMVNN
jgi:amino acid adenylation domain-containing protein